MSAALDAPAQERVRAAHDISYLVSTLGGLHFFEFLRFAARRRSIRPKIYQDESGTYRLEYKDAEERRTLYPRLHKLPNVRLKCPAHMHLPGHNKAPEAGYLEPSSLENFLHAAINVAPSYNLL